MEKRSNKDGSTNSDNSTLGNFYYDWLQNINRPKLKDSAFKKWECVYRNYIQNNKGLCNAKLAHIDTLTLQKITNELLKKHTLSQIRTMNNCLGNCFRYAKSINKIHFNPVEGIVYPKKHHDLQNRGNYISEDKQKRLLSAIGSNELQGIPLTNLMCGLRLGEAMVLQTNDIDFNHMIIKINKLAKYLWTRERNNEGKYLYKKNVTVLKTRTCTREIPLPVILEPIIKILIQKNIENKIQLNESYFDNNLIFCKKNGDYIDNI